MWVAKENCGRSIRSYFTQLLLKMCQIILTSLESWWKSQQWKHKHKQNTLFAYAAWWFMPTASDENSRTNRFTSVGQSEERIKCDSTERFAHIGFPFYLGKEVFFEFSEELVQGVFLLCICACYRNVNFCMLNFWPSLHNFCWLFSAHFRPLPRQFRLKIKQNSRILVEFPRVFAEK